MFSSFFEDTRIPNEYPCVLAKLGKKLMIFSLYVYIEWYRNEITFPSVVKLRRKTLFLLFHFSSIFFFLFFLFFALLKHIYPLYVCWHFESRLFLFDHFPFRSFYLVIYAIRRTSFFCFLFITRALKNYLTALWLTAGSKETYMYIMLHCFYNYYNNRFIINVHFPHSQTLPLTLPLSYRSFAHAIRRNSNVLIRNS